VKKVSVVDYGLGNLHSVAKSFQHLGFAVELLTDGAGIDRAERLVLPGVGAYADGMAGLHARGQTEALRRYGRQQRPLLGICLGAQLLLEESEEFGRHEGLGLVPGRVRAIPSEGVKVPHVGWARLFAADGLSPNGEVMPGLRPGCWAYFVHAFQMHPNDPAHVRAVCRHGPHQLTAAVRHDNVMGMQFHPEKSGESGLTMLASFGLL
jgi:imidazole glycerol-phosphate synthase subunit HisH